MPTETTCLNDVTDSDKLAIEENIEKLIAIVNVASKEFSLENTFKKMQHDWVSMKFEFVAYKQLGLSVLSSFDEMGNLIEDHITKTKTIRNSTLFAEFRRDVDNWYDKLVWYILFIIYFYFN